VKLMPPACVRAYVKRGKTDAADAEAICEAATRPSMRFVPIKSREQQAALSMHRARNVEQCNDSSGCPRQNLSGEPLPLENREISVRAGTRRERAWLERRAHSLPGRAGFPALFACSGDRSAPAMHLVPCVAPSSVQACRFAQIGCQAADHVPDEVLVFVHEAVDCLLIRHMIGINPDQQLRYLLVRQGEAGSGMLSRAENPYGSRSVRH
jgi:hypothetical protein